MENLSDRVDQNSISHLAALEHSLLSGQLDKVCEKYPEFKENGHTAQLELQMFKHKFECKTTSDVLNEFKLMVPECRQLFPCVQKILETILVVPPSSASAERSFSQLRRVKSWLRSTMTQKRLNSLLILTVHKKALDCLDRSAVLNEFIGRSQIRKCAFGTYH